jgi:nicotinamide-nucleotide amidase
MNASILTIGDEICIGQIVNTNAAWIAERLTRIGIEVLIHSAVGDERNIMLNEIDRLFDTTDIVILTGGLGPTHDDLTKPVLCEYFGDELILHEETLRNIEQIFIRRGQSVSERNKEQAMIPSKCTPILNKVGTAPGMIFKKENKILISLPGVPAEMKSMIENSVIPLLENFLQESKTPVVLYKSLITSGIFESSLADLIEDPTSFLEGGALAFLPSYRGVKLRIGVRCDDFNKAKEKIERLEKILLEKVGKFIISTNDEPLDLVIGKILKERNSTVAVAESCTAGLLGAAFTEISGSSEYFLGGIIVYSNISKEHILGVKAETIEKYGAVSEETALELAVNVRNKFSSDYGISITGIAGPSGGSEEKPVGTVWIGIAAQNRFLAKHYQFNGNRDVVRQRAVGMALTMLYEELKIKE